MLALSYKTKPDYFGQWGSVKKKKKANLKCSSMDPVW